jgi:anthranilate phosphoribosyltransferase
MTIDCPTALALVRRAEGMDEAETGAVLDLLMLGGLPPPQGAEVLVAWARRGETAQELAAVVRALLARAVQVPVGPDCMELVGTGGSGLTRYNVSTTCAFVMAAAGVSVVKHGNRGSVTPNGAFDFLEAIGIPFMFPPAEQARLQRETGMCFLFARAMHPAVAAVAPFRKLAAASVKRTIFNLAGPLANPCRPRKQILGVPDERLAPLVAETLDLLGTTRTVVVRGHPGIDEISVTGPSQLWEVRGGRTEHTVVDRLHRPGLNHADLPGGTAVENAEVFQRLIAGQELGPILDMVCVNAGLALDCWFDRPLFATDAGIRQARDLIASGAVAAAFVRHRDLARKLAKAK